MKKQIEISEADFLKGYDPSEFIRPNASVDTVIFTVHEKTLKVLLVKREHHPFKDMWSLVGGFIDVENDETIEDTAKRKLFEKTGVKTPYLEQYCTIGNKSRDPRLWSLTTIYFALLPYSSISLQLGEGAVDIKWFNVSNDGKVSQKLAFDHQKILKGCFERLQQKISYTSLPLFLMPEEFSLTELQETYEVLLGRELEAKSFRRRILSADIIEESGGVRTGLHRPAKLYQLKGRREPYFFLRNIEGSHEG